MNLLITGGLGHIGTCALNQLIKYKFKFIFLDT